MADDGEKTEQPTGKRLSDARNKGQVPRSREAGTFVVLLSGVLSLWAFSGSLGSGIKALMLTSFSLTREQSFTEDEMRRIFVQDLADIAVPILGIAAVVFISSIVGNFLLGGFNFSSKAITPDFNKLSPLSGFRRIFSLNSLIELIKGIAKVAFIGAFCYFAISGMAGSLLKLSFVDPFEGISSALKLLFKIMVIVVCAMLPIVLIDVPYQKWNYIRQLRMTKQEVKDEFKDIEGNPQIKNKIRSMQMQMASRRMMAKVPKADVVVTNPTHYAVALSYDPKGFTAPLVVAKGVDEVAEIIKRIARETNVPVIPIPPLARSLYYTTKLDHEIPRGLFKAVAQVLAWVMAMRDFKAGKSKMRPRDLNPDPEIPDELRF
ncbi:MAG: flagellar biosynthesis protein FlhB [Succinatimonas hippei]|nr:flagellar biosynthesis protein FlhB [Succinatimonas hippei]